ncbi:hypothetical protein SCLCIDRAFT_30269 [Scleroderma citrinum Foug A]|uniref:Uncharacterized protein n=1 Tax=Scleroderma citrinum Foug A TaxID=1036808 RepID=A0A0C3D443_9AGAM|nr:hypothetical protein SCLCIDRAFT_30269 [Scleroderma citrinum Foug A]
MLTQSPNVIFPDILRPIKLTSCKAHSQQCSDPQSSRLYSLGHLPGVPFISRGISFSGDDNIHINCLRRYAGKLDPNTSREIELGISDAIDLALRILERSHKQQNILPFTDTSTSAHLRSTVLSSVLRNVANNILQGSLKAISFSGRCFLTVLSQGTAPKLMLTSHTTPPSYEMINLDVSSQAQSLLIPGGWDQDQD